MILSNEEIIKHATEVFPESILNELLSDSDHATHQLSDFVDSIERALIAKASQQAQDDSELELEFTRIMSRINSVNFEFVNGEPEPAPRSGRSVPVILGVAWKVFKAAKAMPAPKQEPVGITDSEGNLKIYKERLPANTAIYAVPPQAAAIPEWENEAKRAFWCGFELGASFRSCSIFPRWNEYISKRKSDLSAAPKPGGE